MAISAKRNTNYGGAVVTQKYSPLEGIDYKPTQSAEFSALLTNRIKQLADANIFPQTLRLVTDWHSAGGGVSGHDPPLVVISSNRSNWIAAGVQMSRKQWKETRYEGSNDLRALTGLVDKQTQSPPLYVPQRIDGDRKVFIVVHAYEYKQYQEALSDSGMTVVGWSFKKPPGAPGELTGFGASRYAAIEFCKYLRGIMAGVKWDYAWLLDDNVVGVTGGFPGCAAVETAMATTTPTQICSALQGGASVEGFNDIKKWASDEVNAVPSRARPTVLPAPTTPRGIIQQAALWNIKLLTEKNLNFAPLFIASGEDVSLTNYLNVDIPEKKRTPPQPNIPAKPPIPYLYYGGMTVIKEEVKYNDDSRGAELVNKARDAYQKWFAVEESRATAAGGTAPPPVEIESSPRNQSVSDFITEWFTSTKVGVKPTAIAAADKKVQDKAKCQAVEQIAHGAIKNSWIEFTGLFQSTRIETGYGPIVEPYPPPP